METDIVTKVFDGFKRWTPALLAVLIVTGLILFLPDALLQRMALDNIPSLWRVIVGLLFLLSLALIVSIGLFEAWNKATSGRRQKKALNKRIEMLKDMSPELKAILRDMMESKDKSIVLTREAGNTQYLMEKGLIFQPQQIIEYSTDNELRATYNPQPWLMELYNKNPGILEQEKHDDRK